MKILLSSILLLITLSGCDLLNPSKDDPNTLGGDTNLEITQVGYVSVASIKIDNTYLPSGDMIVQKNDNGVVTYKMILNLTGFKDSAMYASLVGPEYRDENGNIFIEFKMKITSEGIQDMFERDKPWTIVKYNDGVGTEYPFTNSLGEKLIRKITEKTGKDDWPFGLMYIKTTKIESDMPSTDKVAKKMIFRANHKFGLVYVEIQMHNGQVVKINIF